MYFPMEIVSETIDFNAFLRNNMMNDVNCQSIID